MKIIKQKLKIKMIFNKRYHTLNKINNDENNKFIKIIYIL